MRLTGHVRLTAVEAKEKKTQTPDEWGLNMGRKGGKSSKKEKWLRHSLALDPHTAYACLVYVECFSHMSRRMSLELNECSCRSEILNAPLASSRLLQPHLRIGPSDVDSLSLQDGF